MPDTIKEVKELIDGVNKAMNELKNDLDGQKEKDGLAEEKLNKLTEDITKKLEKVQEIEQKQKSLEDALERRSQDTGEKADELEKKSKEAFIEYLKTGDSYSVKEAGFKFGDDGVEIRSMQTMVNTDGGYLVRPALANFVVDRVFETSPMRQVARVVTIGTKSIEVLVDDDEAAANWTAEGSGSTDTDTPNLGQKEITAHKIDAEPKISTEMLQDAYIDVEAYLQEKIADKFSRTENTAFISGNGVGKPRGITDYAAWSSAGVYERDKIEQIASGATAALTANGLIDLQNSLKEPYQARATFLMKRATYGEILKLKGNDQYFFGQTFMKDGQPTMTLLGKDVVFCDDMAAVGAGAEPIAYGDFSVGYTIVDRVGLNILRNPYKENGFVKYYVAKRTGGDVTNFDAIKLQTVST